MDDAELSAAVAALTAEVRDRPWKAPSIDELMAWGKHKGLTYREAAQRDPAYLQWAAKKIEGVKGQLCAEALALFLGVVE